LSAELSKLDVSLNFTPATLTKRLKSLSGLFRKDFGIAVDFARTHGSKQILLKRHEPVGNQERVGASAEIAIPPADALPTRPI
jgi:hypothetical protein